MDTLADPVDTRVTADGLVLGIDKDNLEVLVGGVMVDPVGVEDTEVSAAAADTLLGGGPESALVLELVDTHVGGLACWELASHHPISFLKLHTVGGTLRSGLLAATASHTSTVNNIALLGLVAETTSLVGAGRTGSPVDGVQLTELY